MLTVGRTLMTNPRVLLLDEPSEGLAPVVVDSIVETVRRLRDAGMTILLSEQNLSFAHRVADLLSEHFDHVMQARGRVLNWEPPDRNVSLATFRSPSLPSSRSVAIGSVPLNVVVA